jgi:L-rhamnose mutarotase
MQRYGSVIQLKPEKLAEYKDLHAHVWPEVLRMIRACNIRNYSIYYKDGYLFSYFEYTGEDLTADMQKMADDATTQAWWKLTDTCQQPLESRQPGEWWASMEEFFQALPRPARTPAGMKDDVRRAIESFTPGAGKNQRLITGRYTRW